MEKIVHALPKDTGMMREYCILLVLNIERLKKMKDKKGTNIPEQKNIPPMPVCDPVKKDVGGASMNEERMVISLDCYVCGENMGYANCGFGICCDCMDRINAEEDKRC